MATPDTSRNELRRQLVDRRMAISPQEHAERSGRIRQHLRTHFAALSTQCVAFCWPFRNEPDLRPLIEEWVAAQAASGRPGFSAALPVVRAPRSPLGFRPWQPGCAMAVDAFGIPTPTEGDFVTPQALLIPVNGFDAAGYRIGYGGGFFDRTLAALGRQVLAIGVGFELARLESITPGAHDLPLDAMVSEAGVFYPTAARSPDPAAPR